MSVARRTFIAGLGAAAAWPMAARAQQAKVPVIGYLSATSASDSGGILADFRGGLAEAGYVEGRNVAIEYRWAEGRYDRLPALATELVHQSVDVIVSMGGTPTVLAAKAATIDIPIVFLMGADPIAAGIVTSLSRPDRNLTGVIQLAVVLGPKRMELMHEAVPTLPSMAALINPANPAAAIETSDMQAAARTLGVQLHVLHASNESELDMALAAIADLGPGALTIGADLFFNSKVPRLAAWTVDHRLPAIYQFREFVLGGGLMSYGRSNAEAGRPVGIYTGRILKGEKPADLPVQQVTKVELVINMKTAKALGITMPLSLLGRADEVIE